MIERRRVNYNILRLLSASVARGNAATRDSARVGAPYLCSKKEKKKAVGQRSVVNGSVVGKAKNKKALTLSKFRKRIAGGRVRWNGQQRGTKSSRASFDRVQRPEEVDERLCVKWGGWAGGGFLLRQCGPCSQLSRGQWRLDALVLRG